MKPKTPNASHATPHFWREMRMKTHQARQVDLSRLRRSRSASSRPNKARSARKRSTCSKSTHTLSSFICINLFFHPIFNSNLCLIVLDVVGVKSQSDWGSCPVVIFCQRAVVCVLQLLS